MKQIYIKTYEQFIKTFGKVNEGGNALDTTQRIANKYIPNTLEFITAKILPVIGLEGFNIDAAVVGSAGKKDPDVTSGDIDIAVSLDKIAGYAGIDVKGVLKYINDALSAKGYETNIQYGFHQVNVAVPIDGDSKKGYCQVDLMVTDNLDWSKFIYFSPDYRKAESRYSGAFRGMLINAIASEGMKRAVKHDEESGEMEEYEQMVNRATHGLFQVRKTLRGKRGLVKTPKLMKDYEKKITNIPEEAIKILFGEGVKAKDVESFEGIWKVMHGNQFPFPGKRETIANKFLWYMKNMEIPVPTEIVKKYPNLIKENNTDKWIGFIRLASPVLMIKPRNEVFGGVVRATQVNRSMLNGAIIVPVQPFGYNYLGGKLLCLICCSHWVREQINEKYGINLTMFETTSLYGTTTGMSMYDGLKPFLRHAGDTVSDFPPPVHDRVFNALDHWFKDLNGGEYLVPMITPTKNNPKSPTTSRKHRTENKMKSLVKKHLKSYGLTDKLIEFNAAIEHGKSLTERKRYYYSTYGYSNVADVIINGAKPIVNQQNWDKHHLENIIQWWKKKAQNRWDGLNQDGRLRRELEIHGTGMDIDIIR